MIVHMVLSKCCLTLATSFDLKALSDAGSLARASIVFLFARSNPTDKMVTPLDLTVFAVRIAYLSPPKKELC